MIDPNKPIRIFDDTSRNEDIDVNAILYHDDNIILCSITITDHESINSHAIINRHNNSVTSEYLDFYLARNI